MASRIVRYGSTVNLGDFDVLAFDLDHTLARYNNPKLMELIYNCLRRTLVDILGYDAAAMLKPFELAHFQKGVILDFHTGDAVKLDADGRVAVAYHGFTRLHLKDISRRYGESRVWPGVKLLRDLKRHDSFFVLLTYFDGPCMSLFMQLVEHLDVTSGVDTAKRDDHADHVEALLATGTLSYDEVALPPKYLRLKKDFITAFDYIFENVVGFATGRGGFFSALKADPNEYICARPELKETLRDIRKTGKHQLVLVTNSHIHFAVATLEASFGEDWRSCFDVVMFNGLKPRFFHHTAPWYDVDWVAGTDGTVRTRLAIPISPSSLGNDTAAAVGTQGSAVTLQRIFDEVKAHRFQHHARTKSHLSTDLLVDVELTEEGQLSSCIVTTSSSELEHASVHGASKPAAGRHAPTTLGLTEALQSPVHKAATHETPAPAPAAFNAEMLLSKQTSHARAKGRSEVIYFGDHVNGDVVPAVVHAGWSSVSVVEELECSVPQASVLRPGGGIVELPAASAAPNFDAEYHKTCIWGDFFAASPDDHAPSFFCDVLAKYSVMAVNDLGPALRVMVQTEAP